MGSDPRVKAAMEWDAKDGGLLPDREWFAGVLAVADAADRDRGVVRVDTRDEATVERLGRAIYEDLRLDGDAEIWEGLTEDDRESYLRSGRAVLAALTQGGPR